MRKQEHERNRRRREIAFWQKQSCKLEAQKPCFGILIVDDRQANDILGYLQDTQLAKKSLQPAMDELSLGIDRCSLNAQKIENEFDLLLETVQELNLAIGNQMSE